MTTKEMTPEQIKARNAEYARKHREKKKKERLAAERAAKKNGEAKPAAAAADIPTPEQVQQKHGGTFADRPLATLIQKTIEAIRVKVQASVQQVIDTRMTGENGVAGQPSATELLAVSAQTAGQDVETEALMRLLGALRNAERIRALVDAGKFDQVVPSKAPVVDAASGKGKRKSA